jgi:hypothetical protein
MKNIVYSILSLGAESPKLNQFVEICTNLSIPVLNRSKFKEYILYKTGLSVRDLARDLIADLFKVNGGKYIYINNHFEDILVNYKEVPAEIIKAKLSTLVISRTNQGITEIRESFGEIYFRIKRSIYLHISRHKDEFKKVIYEGNTYIFNCPEKEVKFDMEQMPVLTMLDFMYASNHKKYSITTITNYIFGILNRQKDYCKDLMDTTLYNIVAEFFNSRMQDYISLPENVHYNNLEEEI